MHVNGEFELHDDVALMRHMPCFGYVTLVSARPRPRPSASSLWHPR